jgi:hypothetical protein
MKNINAILFRSILGVLLVTAACSKLEQDPLVDKKGQFDRGIEKPTVPEAPKPVDSDAIRIDAVSYFSFLEQEADEIKISARVLIPDYELQISIPNIADFPGATYDAANGVFRWNPPRNLIPVDRQRIERMLQVRVAARKENNPALIGTKSIVVALQRNLQIPVVRSVDISSISLREGRDTNFRVLVRDLDADLSDNRTWPRLELGMVVDRTPLMNVVKFLRIDREGQDLSYSFNMNLMNKELTKNFVDAGLSFTPISRYQSVGTPANLSIRIFTSFSILASTWQPIQVVAGEKIDQTFLIMDTKSELTLRYLRTENLPGGATMSCTPANRNVLSCRLQWVAANPGNYLPSSVVRKVNEFSNLDPYQEDQTFGLQIVVAPPPTTTTTTVPTTTTTVPQTTTTVPAARGNR